MKKVILLSTVMLLGATLAFGQVGGVIGSYADPGGLNCNVTDAAPGLLPIFIVHTLSPGATAAQFAAPIQLCQVGSLWLSDTGVFAVTIGNSQGGVAIGYGTCQVSPTHILTINYFVNGITALCCAYSVIPDPNVVSMQVEVVDCAGNLLTATGRTNTINGTVAQCDCNVVPVEESTWGKVKSLYVD